MLSRRSRELKRIWMRRSSRLTLLAAVAIPTYVSAGDIVQLNWNATVREYCHVIHFASGWKRILPTGRSEDRPEFKFRGCDFEFRVPGLLSTKFLVRGIVYMGDLSYA